MATPIQVLLNRIELVAHLESSTGGKVVQSNGEFLLEGPFRLIVAGQPSDPVVFNPSSTRAVLRQSGNSWFLKSAAKTNFNFAQPLRLQSSARGAWLECHFAWLLQRDRRDAMCVLSLDDASISLDGGAPSPGKERLVYHTGAGLRAEQLIKQRHPEDTWTGFFVLPFEDGHVVHFGGLRDIIRINHAQQAEVIVSRSCEILFRLPSSSSTIQALLLVAGGTDDLRIRAARASRLMMAASPADSQWTRLDVRATRLEAVDGWLRSTALQPAELLLGHVPDANAPVAGATSLLTSTSRLQWELSLPRTGDPPRATRARMIYQSDLGRDALAADRRARYYGLKVQGLSSRAGVQPTLDADLLVFEVDPDVNGGDTFCVKSGGPITIGEETRNAILVPKRNPRTAESDRILDVPVAHELALRVTAPAEPQTAFRIDTSENLLAIVSPVLASAPMGISARGAGIRASFDRWQLGLPKNKPELNFDIDAKGLIPRDGEPWLSAFETADPGRSYALIEHPGTNVVIDGSSPVFRSAAGGGVSKKTEIITIKSPGGKEVVAYSAFFAILSWAAARCVSQGTERCLDESKFKVSFPELTDAAFEEYVKSNGLRDLRVVYFANGAAGPGALRRIRDFIDENMLGDGKPKPPKFHWSFAAGLSILLFEKDEQTGVERYCDDIMLERDPSAEPGLGFDFSAESAFHPGHFGWSASAWKKLQEDSPLLWPRALGKEGARLDPSDLQWRGTMFRDLPLFLPTPPVVEEFPFIQDLIRTINERITLEYGWRDESGATWVGGLKNADPGTRFTPASWASVLEMFLMEVRVKGAAGRIVTAEAICRIRLPLIKEETTSEPLEVVGVFGLNLEEGNNPITRIDITQDGAPIATDSIPGFDKVALRRISTDLKTAQLELLLTATPELASALPIFSSDRPQKAYLSFDFGKDPSLILSLALPAELETNLFGRWPLTLQAMSIEFATVGSVEIKLRIRGRLNLGLEGFGSVGAEVVVTRAADGKIRFNVELNEISGKLSVGSATLSGSLRWERKDGDSGFVELTNAGAAGREREFWGTLILEDPGIIGRNQVAVRVGNQGETSYWIASLESSAKVPFGIGELRSPALLLGHKVDLNGGLAKAVLDPTGSILALLRPSSGALKDWLAKWEPSKDVSSVIAGSGYLHFHDQVASAPIKDGKIDPQKLSSLIFTDTGLVRVDGVAAMLDVVTLRFGVAIDFKAKRILIGLQAPTIKYPSEADPQYEIQAGYITLGSSFADDNPYLRLSIGWPERQGNTEFERDWSKATKVYVKTMWPINTFWGGYLAELTKDRILFGFAVRAGWTWSQSVGGGVAKGSAELGITLGGVFQFAVAWGARSGQGLGDLPFLPDVSRPAAWIQPIPRLSDLSTAAFAAQAAVISAAMVSAEDSLILMAGLDLQMSAEIFGDVWGKASVEFLGVTLVAISVRAYARFRVCGTLNRGITQAKARVGFEVSVTVLCVTYSTTAQIDIVLVEGECPLLAMDRLFMPQELPAFVARPPYSLPAPAPAL